MYISSKFVIFLKTAYKVKLYKYIFIDIKSTLIMYVDLFQPQKWNVPLNSVRRGRFLLLIPILIFSPETCASGRSQSRPQPVVPPSTSAASAEASTELAENGQ